MGDRHRPKLDGEPHPFRPCGERRLTVSASKDMRVRNDHHKGLDEPAI
jgi:hypothetical protein